MGDLANKVFKGVVKAILAIILITILLIGYFAVKIYNNNHGTPREKARLEKEILSKFEQRHGEEFWFVRNLCYSPPHAFGDRGYYSGMIYSESLRELDFPLGIYVSAGRTGSITGSDYENVMVAYEFNQMVEPKLREIFGSKANVDTSRMARGMWKELLRKRQLGYNDTGTYGHINTQVVEVFVDDLDKIDEEEYRQKTFEFSSYLYHEWNVRAYLQIFIRDDSFFENYDLVKRSVFPDFLRKTEVKEILKKIKNKESITQDEKQILVDNFRKNLPNEGYGLYLNLNTTNSELSKENINSGYGNFDLSEYLK